MTVSPWSVVPETTVSGTAPCAEPPATNRTVVDLVEYTHTCPGDPTPHVYATRRVLVDQADPGECLTPVTVRVGDARVSVPCGELLPAIGQCDACRPVVEVRRVTRVHTGPATVAATGPVSGMAAAPCRVCGEPLAAVLAAGGVHILCARGWVR